jgi:hypothetical protein
MMSFGEHNRVAGRGGLIAEPKRKMARAACLFGAGVNARPASSDWRTVDFGFQSSTTAIKTKMP